jgi:hypothetical protein
MATSRTDQGDRCLARAWALLDRGEHLARAGDGQDGAGLWLLAANAILRARDALEAVHPAASSGRSRQVPVEGTCAELVRSAARQLARVPSGHEPAGLWLALVHLGEAELEVRELWCS